VEALELLDDAPELSDELLDELDESPDPFDESEEFDDPFEFDCDCPCPDARAGRAPIETSPPRGRGPGSISERVDTAHRRDLRQISDGAGGRRPPSF